MKDGIVPDRQRQIYAAGLRGERPALPLAIDALEAKARELLSSEVYDFVAGGAGSEETVQANRYAFQRYQIVPRMLRDLTQRDFSIELFGRTLPAPVMLAPIGVQSIIHPDGELATARAASSLGIPFVLSTVASRTLEEAAEVAGDTPRWYQLYWPTDRDVAASLVSRAERAGYGAIVVTVDTGMVGWRVRDLQNAYLPFLLGVGLANLLSDPAFRRSLSKTPEADPQAAMAQVSRIFNNPALTWDDLPFLRQHTHLPILLKGIQHPDDAALAVQHGIDGIIVSNHGGRQVDGAIGSLDALPDVIAAVGGQIPVLFDSGIRHGADAFKALALGAKAVLLGRPYIWGLACNGEQGVYDVIANFVSELETTLALAGYISCADLTPAALRRL